MNSHFITASVSNVMAQALATGLFISRCTIQAPDGVLGASGAPSGTYANVTGLVNIRCMDAPQPPSADSMGSASARAMGQIETRASRHVLLESFYPELLDEEWRYGARAIVTTRGRSETFEICGAESDSQRQMTRLELKLVTAGAVQS